ncbi:OmpH family outer membrane protein [Mucilaginibacter aquatilis]|uniref:OmpH family outer membrane protein n=1 Tax=Mucilaginibacter aquatilis TaxID=1517760 RepID=A0A6I4I3W4_9SPHI|nr:OmpH family outer membrane protein [Mucilaginibacter aquatilis]MVN89751.1 OmpH family outer membrane protein [Mucilaginibacter aquatilis]
MKNPASILSKITLSILVAASLAACNQNKTNDKPATTPAAAKVEDNTLKNGDIVFVNSDTLLNKYQYFKDMADRLEKKGKAAQADLQNRGQAFQREVAEYQKSAATMSADQRQATEQRLARKQQELQAYQQNTGAQVQQDQAGEQAKLYEKVADFLKVYAKDKGYKMVMTYQKGNSGILYGDASLDITSDVVAKLNEAYNKDKK